MGDDLFIPELFYSNYEQLALRAGTTRIIAPETWQKMSAIQREGCISLLAATVQDLEAAGAGSHATHAEYLEARKACGLGAENAMTKAVWDCYDLTSRRSMLAQLQVKAQPVRDANWGSW